MTDDDDDLQDYDLDAWDVPAPPTGLADVVIARARQGAAVTALEPEAPRSRRFWLAGGAGVLVAAAAIGTVFMLGSKHAAPTHGSVDGGRAQKLDLDSVTAELDSGASAQWTRRGDTITVDQPRGNATWRVGDDHLRIETAGTQIDATGASLRVEVHMQLSDARVIGASTLAAAAVAFVTVVVYEGHVQVHSAGQTVNVEPGGTVEVRPGQPPAPPILIGNDDRVDELQRKLDQLQKQLDAMPGYNVNDDVKVTRTPAAGGTPPAPSNCDEVSCVLDDYRPACCAKFHHHATGGGGAGGDVDLDRAMISTAMAAAKPHVLACGEQHPAQGVLKARIKVAPDGTVTSVDVTQTPDPQLSPCVVSALQAVVFPRTKIGGSFSYPFVFDNPATRTTVDPFSSPRGTSRPIPSCDAEALDEDARQAEAVGQHANALSKMEKAIACQPDPHRFQLAFMSACNAGNLPKARFYYARLARDTPLVQMCIRNRISVADLQAVGYVVLSSQPPATILVDGVATQLTTPVTGHQLPLAPGKHKVTFVVDKDKYTYAVVVAAGETVTLSKTLE